MTNTSSHSTIRVLLLLFFLGLSTDALAVTPTIAKVTGKVRSGQLLTISGTNMVQENKANWIDYGGTSSTGPNFKSVTNYGFEGASNISDGYCSAGQSSWLCTGVYDRTTKLMGNQSVRYNTHGAVSNPPTIGGLGSQDAFMQSSNDFYWRGYFRYHNNGDGTWPDQDLKMIEQSGNVSGTVSNAFWQPHTFSSSAPSQFRVTTTQAGSNANVFYPYPFAFDRWFEVEGRYSVPSSGSNAGTVETWVDGKYMGSTTIDGTTPGMFYMGQLTVWNTGSGYDMDLNIDNLVLSTTRIYPSSAIEISNSSVYGQGTVVYQAPVYLSDNSIQITADLTGLGSGPYYLWVTNNGQQRSAPYKLGGNKGADATISPAADGTILFQEDFADADFVSRGWYDNPVATVTTADYASGSTSSAQFSFAAGAITPTSGGAMRKQFTATDSVYVSYWEKYGSNWQEQAGGAIPFLT